MKNEYAFLTTIKLQENCINLQYFDDKESYYWLYKYSKYALTMRLSIGFDYLFEDEEYN